MSYCSLLDSSSFRSTLPLCLSPPLPALFANRRTTPNTARASGATITIFPSMTRATASLRTSAPLPPRAAPGLTSCTVGIAVLPPPEIAPIQTFDETDEAASALPGHKQLPDSSSELAHSHTNLKSATSRVPTPVSPSQLRFSRVKVQVQEEKAVVRADFWTQCLRGRMSLEGQRS